MNLPDWRVLTRYAKLLQKHKDIDGLLQVCSNPIANARELLQSFTKPLIYLYLTWFLDTESAM